MQRNRYVKDEASKVAKVKKEIKVKIKKKKKQISETQNMI